MVLAHLLAPSLAYVLVRGLVHELVYALDRELVHESTSNKYKNYIKFNWYYIKINFKLITGLWVGSFVGLCVGVFVGEVGTTLSQSQLGLGDSIAFIILFFLLISIILENKIINKYKNK